MHPIGSPLETPIEVSLQMKFRRSLLFEFDDVYDTQAGAEYIASASS